VEIPDPEPDAAFDTFLCIFPTPWGRDTPDTRRGRSSGDTAGGIPRVEMVEKRVGRRDEEEESRKGGEV
jgi:hypothetical protein